MPRAPRTGRRGETRGLAEVHSPIAFNSDTHDRLIGPELTLKHIRYRTLTFTPLTDRQAKLRIARIVELSGQTE
jgi:hypothetical protein